MKCIGIIPARYKSTRFEGKPLANICGRPMVWWVYETVKKSKKLSEVYVATDDERIVEVCNKLNINVIMTSKEHDTPTDRIHEVSNKIKADLYISINGDEPLIDIKTIEKVIPKETISKEKPYIANIMTKIKDPVEVIDFTNLKIIYNDKNDLIYISRSPIPYPKGTMNCDYMKHVGVYAFNKRALDFYHNASKDKNEIIEDIDLLRFITNNIRVKMIEAKCNTLSVDTPKDLERVRKIISKRENKQQ